MIDIHVAWWNLENLFDHQGAARHPALAKKLGSELKGWTAAVRDRKLAQLATIVGQMFNGAGPDLLGVGEVEHEELLTKLINLVDLPDRNYAVVHHDSPDARGIDVSFIVDTNMLTFSNPQHREVLKRTATRDVFWAMFDVVATGATFVAMANHWPARSAGQYVSEPYRMMAGETVSVILEELTDEDPDRPVLLMGDFNDEPFQRSMQEYLLGSRDREKIVRARTPQVWNLMWPQLTVERPGTFRYGSAWNMLDQFLVTKPLATKGGGWFVPPEQVEVFRPESMVGKAGRPRAFGRPSKESTYDPDGYSDHFPITMVMQSM